MKSEQISEALNHLSEAAVEEALVNRGKRKRRFPPRFLWIGAACLVLVTGLLLWGSRGGYPPVLGEPDQLLTNAPPLTEPSPADRSEEYFCYAPTKDTVEDDQGTPTSPDVTADPIAHAPSKHLLFSPQYPKMPLYPAGNNVHWDTELQWMKDREAFYEPVKDFQIPDGFMNFYRNTAQTFLMDRLGENATYSPLNLYLALSMLAEVTGSTTRQEILTLLSAGSIEEVRANAAAFWLSNYSDDGILTCQLGNSIWLREDMAYEEDTLAALAEIYYAASYSGTMGSEAFNRDLGNWINEHTGGLLQDQLEGLGFEEQTVAALVSALHFKAGWQNTFLPTLTEQRKFYGEEESVTMDFLHSEENDTIYYGDNFTACKLPMSQGTSMWFFLPDEGVSPQELLVQETIYGLPSYESEVYKQEVELSLYLPKFDLSSKTDLKEGLLELGLSEVFDSLQSDFSPLTRDSEEVFLSEAEHCARVRIDEEGCEAAAYTLLGMAMESIPPELDQVELVFDRPFVFVITGRTNHPLLTGIVDQP